MATITEGVISTAEFQQSAEYRLCSEKQRFWLDTLIANGFDYIHATSTAFDMASLRNAAIYSYAVRRSPTVRAALNLFLHGGDERAIFIEGLKETIRRSKEGSTAKLRAQSLYASLVFKVKDEEADEPDEALSVPKARKVEVHPYDPTKRYAVGDYVSDKDANDGSIHLGQVAAIGETGRPTSVVAVKSDAEGQPIFNAVGKAIRE